VLRARTTRICADSTTLPACALTTSCRERTSGANAARRTIARVTAHLDDARA
jgi:hypothetical protein